MGKNVRSDWVDEVFSRGESPWYMGSPSQPAVPAPIRSRQAYDYGGQHTRPSPSSPTSSSRSSTSRSSVSSSSYGGSDTSSTAQSSRSSAPSAAPPWHQPTLNQTLTMAPFNYGYNLPCEFTYAGCHLRFHPESFEEWIDHSSSHFGEYAPPVRTVCTFCDQEFHGPNNAEQNWRRRMVHIGSHFNDLRRFDGVDLHHRRPCFWTLEHLYAIRRISREDYTAAIDYSERAECENTHPYGWKPKEMRVKEERNSGTNHDLRKERHQMKKEKGKGSRTHRQRS